jgi:hypothetical protein
MRPEQWEPRPPAPRLSWWERHGPGIGLFGTLFALALLDILGL